MEINEINENQHREYRETTKLKVGQMKRLKNWQPERRVSQEKIKAQVAIIEMGWILNRLKEVISKNIFFRNGEKIRNGNSEYS